MGEYNLLFELDRVQQQFYSFFFKCRSQIIGQKGDLFLEIYFNPLLINPLNSSLIFLKAWIRNFFGKEIFWSY